MMLVCCSDCCTEMWAYNTQSNVIFVRSDITCWYTFSVLEGCDHGIADYGDFHIDTLGKDIHMVSGIMRPQGA
jgi:hypothetical protein